MARQTLCSLLFTLVLVATAAGQASVNVGDAAPDFELRDSSGKTYKLSDYRGEKVVVLEFFRSGGW